jgi:hypothetical protein
MVRARIISGIAVVLIAEGCLGLSAQSIPDPRAELQLPKGNWTLQILPGKAPGLDSSPVVLLQITSNAGMGMAVSRFALQNRSKDNVISLRLGWKLYVSTDSEKPLVTGLSRSVLLSNPLAAGESADVRATVLVFASALRDLIPPGRTDLEGVYMIELAVAEVCFEGGSVWVRRVWAGRQNSQAPIVGEVLPFTPRSFDANRKFR